MFGFQQKIMTQQKNNKRESVIYIQENKAVNTNWFWVALIWI